jgi:hypothetical protein
MQVIAGRVLTEHDLGELYVATGCPWCGSRCSWSTTVDLGTVCTNDFQGSYGTCAR